MNPVQFFDLFEKEMISYNKPERKEIREYYKLFESKLFYPWRKAYLLQRLQYLQANIIGGKSDVRLWDVGCGYGTSSIFLSLNNIRSTGTTLEWYHKYIPERKEYWKQFGPTDFFEVKIENLFDSKVQDESFDYILVQDTLHHLEPIDEALQIFNKALKKDGKIIVIEENGNNIIQRLKLYLYRGNRRIIEFYDENLQKMILLGNENIRPMKSWESIFRKNGFEVSDKQYIRFFPPFILNNRNALELTDVEQKIWKSLALFREYFFFGLNFSARKADLH